MSICISNKTDQKKFDILKSIVGEREAERDFFEQDGVVRPPSIVLAKIEERLQEIEPEPIYNYTDEVLKDSLIEEDVASKVRDVVAKRNATESLNAIDAISNRLGVDYQIISSEESKAMRNSEVDANGFL